MNFDKIIVWHSITIQHLISHHATHDIGYQQLKLFLQKYLKVPDIFKALCSLLNFNQKSYPISILKIYDKLRDKEIYGKLPSLSLKICKYNTNNRTTKQNLRIVKISLLIYCIRLLSMQDIGKVLLHCSLNQFLNQTSGVYPVQKQIVYQILKQADLILIPKVYKQLELKIISPILKMTESKGEEQTIPIYDFLVIAANAVKRSQIIQLLQPFVPKSKQRKNQHGLYQILDPQLLVRSRFLQGDAVILKQLQIMTKSSVLIIQGQVQNFQKEKQKEIQVITNQNKTVCTFKRYLHHPKLRNMIKKQLSQDKINLKRRKCSQPADEQRLNVQHKIGSQEQRLKNKFLLKLGLNQDQPFQDTFLRQQKQKSVSKVMKRPITAQQKRPQSSVNINTRQKFIQSLINLID